MNKRICRVLGAFFAVAAVLSLFLPVYRTNIDGGESWLCILKGINMVEFSVFGVMVVIIPILMAVFNFLKVRNKVRGLFQYGLPILCIFCLLLADSAMKKWIYEVATGPVESYANLLIYTVFISLSAVFSVMEVESKR